MADTTPSSGDRQTAAKIVVATTVALSFISFWRAAAIVLSDLASSAFYAGGIAEQAIGKSAPWFILGVMLFSFAVRSVYMESSSKALRIMQVTTVMVVAFIIWCPISLLINGGHVPPAPVPANLQFSDTGLGWFKGTFWPTIPVVAIIIAFGHSLLSMSGFETLAQVYREIAYPKLLNLKRTGNLLCWYAVICTGVITVFAGMIIP